MLYRYKISTNTQDNLAWVLRTMILSTVLPSEGAITIDMDSRGTQQPLGVTACGFWENCLPSQLCLCCAAAAVCLSPTPTFVSELSRSILKPSACWIVRSTGWQQSLLSSCTQVVWLLGDYPNRFQGSYPRRWLPGCLTASRMIILELPLHSASTVNEKPTHTPVKCQPPKTFQTLSFYPSLKWPQDFLENFWVAHLGHWKIHNIQKREIKGRIIQFI